MTPTNKYSPEKRKSVTIYIDPGHGGDDSGSKIFRRKEKNINLSIAVLVGKILTNNGYNVILSRDSDVNVSLKKRYSDANNTNSELFISIHTNSTNPLKSGYSVIYPNNKADDSFQNNSREENSALLAEKISESLTDIGIRKGPDGVYSDVRGLAVLRGTEMPSVIVEVGYIFTDGKKLSNNTYQERVSSGIANGIQNYLNK